MKNSKTADTIMQALLSHPDTLDIADPETVAMLQHLAAKGYVDLHRAWGGDIISISLTQSGIAYFEVNRERRKEKWKDRLWGYLLGVFSGVTVTLIVQYTPVLLKMIAAR